MSNNRYEFKKINDLLRKQNADRNKEVQGYIEGQQVT